MPQSFVMTLMINQYLADSISKFTFTFFRFILQIVFINFDAYLTILYWLIHLLNLYNTAVNNDSFKKKIQ